MANGIVQFPATVPRPIALLGFRCALPVPMVGFRWALPAMLLACAAACGCQLLSEGVRASPAGVSQSPTVCLRSAPPDVILASLEAFASDTSTPLPPQVAELKDHSNGRVRAAALRTLARRGHPEALHCARQALGDHDPQVVLAAVAALGELPTPESRELLERLLIESPNPSLRAAAVAALGKLRAKESVLAAASDPAWRVRLEAARQLSNWPEAAVADVADQLLKDPSPEVQRAVVAAVADWPIESSGPILLAAMSSGSPTLVKAAAEALACRWPPAAAFAADAPAERRAELLAALEKQFRQEFPARASRNGWQEGSPGDEHQPPSQRWLAQIEAMLDRSDIDSLRRRGPELLDAVEYLQLQQARVLPEALYIQVLPEVAPEFALLAELARGELHARRQASQRLAALAKQKPLRPLAVERLSAVVQSEQDVLVWCAALDAIDNDASPAAVRLAYAGLSHPLPEVRRRACQYLGAHPDPRHAPQLLSALNDRSHSVVVAAVRALGMLSRLDDASAVRQLSGASNEEIRLEAAIALVRLGDLAGPAALERLSYSEDPIVQARVAQVMGEHPDPAYLEPLIRMLDGRPNVRRAALESLPKVAGGDVVQRAGPPVPTTEQVQRWKQWYQRRQSL
jgi:HEAT repeat protein